MQALLMSVEIYRVEASEVANMINCKNMFTSRVVRTATLDALNDIRLAG